MVDMGQYVKTYYQKIFPKVESARIKYALHHLSLDELEKVFGDVKWKEILDVGCGGGRTSLPLALLGGKVTAFDVQQEEILKCKRDLPKVGEGLKIKFFVADASKYLSTLKAESFDLCLCSEVLEHIPPRGANKTIKEMIRVIKKGGKIFITTPNGEVFNLPYPKKLKLDHPGSHKKHWTSKELIEAFVKYGINKIEIRYECHKHSHIYNKLYAPFSQLDCWVVEKKPPLSKIYLKITEPLVILYNSVLYPILVWIFEKYELSKRKDPSGRDILLCARK